MKIRTALSTYFIAVAMLIGVSIALVGITGGVVLMGSFAMDSPTSTAGPKVDFALKILGSILTVWFAPAHELLKIMGQVGSC